MLAPWHEFYALLGTAAAALVALLFVAASIGANVMTAESAGATGTYMSPVVFHYANILFLSLIALIPDLTPTAFALTVCVAALGSLAYSILIMVRVHRHSFSDLADRIAYGCVPVFCYACGVVVACLVLWGSKPAGLNLLAAAAMLLLVINMRNAWDLMMSLARRNAEQHQRESAPSIQPPSP